jgi:Protein of unknown function (DUF1553)/Protein of unknown function (DUF1549)/Planctomycete cytochrome C
MSDIPLRSARRKRADQRITTAWRLACTLVAAFVVWPAAAAQPASKEGIAFFESKIRPVLAKNCFSCHSGSVQARGGLRLDTRAGLLIGGQSGPAIVPGDPENSKILSVLHYEGPEMPPAGQLPKATLENFERWIAIGAPDPRGDESKYAANKRIDFAAARQTWTFKAPKKPDVAAINETEWAWSPVDRLVHVKQKKAGTKPVKDADAVVWLRRVSFDLVGLPPTAGQVAAIERDSSRKARERIVDHLLASLRYGERWGRHWLDIARYAESTGKERNFIYPQAWRYRDWVIDAFNADKPYNQFLQEQIAGDLLAAGSFKERDAHIIATGFLALGPKGINERNRESYLLDIADEQIENVGRAVMGLSVGCARCHDHKFDPVTMGDYYALAGIFRSSDARVGISNRQQVIGQPSYLVELTGTGTSVASLADPELIATIKTLDKERQTKQDELRRLRENTKPEVLAAVAAVTPTQSELAAILNADPGQNGKDELGPDPKPGPPPVPGSFEDVLQKQRAFYKLTRKLNGLKNQLGRQTAKATAIGVVDLPKPKDIHIRLRGEADNLGPVVPRGFPQVITVSSPPAIESNESGRRQLADWLTRPDHPLTSRVIVNRIWAKLFNTGIVPTVDDFGDQGQEPTNPELLDYLAVRFVDQGWSIKKTIKELVLSRTYQLSSEDDATNLAKDEANESLWRWNRKRLDAEALRDRILAANGQLDLNTPKGSPVIGLGLRELGPYSDFAPIQKPSRHRSVYLPILRNKPPEALALFDLPDPSLVVGQRDITTSPTQGLFLLNSPFILEQSEHLARRLLDEKGLDDDGRVQRAFLAVLSRKPSRDEEDRVLQFLAATVSADGRKADADKLEAWSRLAQTLLALPESRYLF